jgi:hypothetical protein
MHSWIHILGFHRDTPAHDISTFSLRFEFLLTIQTGPMESSGSRRFILISQVIRHFQPCTLSAIPELTSNSWVHLENILLSCGRVARPETSERFKSSDVENPGFTLINAIKNLPHKQK